MPVEVRLREQREAEQRMDQKRREEEVRSAPLWPMAPMGWGFGNKNGGCFSNHNGYPPETSLAGKSMKIPYNYCKWRFYWGKLTKTNLGFHQILIWG